MLVATFTQTSGWAGKTITYDGGVFTLQGHGRVSAVDVLTYDGQGYLEWAQDGLRDLVLQAASAAAPAAAPGPPTPPSRDFTPAERPASTGGTPPSPTGAPGIGVAGFILSLLGVSLPGIILSWVGYAKARREGRPSGLSLAGIIIGCGALAVSVVVLALLIAGGLGTDRSTTTVTARPQASARPASAPPAAATVDVSGSYEDLVTRANGLYDKGDAALQNQDVEGGTSFFRQAAATYAAAWGMRQTDPGVGTDYATALFYSGEMDAALKQVKAVIAAFPDFQMAYYNLGNYLSHKASLAKQSGDTAAATQNYAAAAAVYRKTISLDPASAAGKQAQTSLDALPR